MDPILEKQLNEFLDCEDFEPDEEEIEPFPFEDPVLVIKFHPETSRAIPTFDHCIFPQTVDYTENK